MRPFKTRKVLDAANLAPKLNVWFNLSARGKVNALSGLPPLKWDTFHLPELDHVG